MVRGRSQGARVPDIFDEVNEDLRAERMKRLMARYGGLLGGLALVIVLGVAGLQGWRWWEERKSAEAAAAYIAAAEFAAAPGTQAGQAAQRFAALAAAAPGGYAVLGRLRAAALHAEAGEREAALALWDQVARDSGTEPLYRDLATLMWGLHALDSGDAAAIEARLAPLAVPGHAFQHSAEEIRALAALRRGEAEVARRGLAALVADRTAPDGVRERAQRVLAGLGG